MPDDVTATTSAVETEPSTVDEQPTGLPDSSPEAKDEERVSVASQRQLIWWRFRRHKLAMAGAVVVLLFYLVAAFADFLATSDPLASDGQRSLLPPQSVHLFDGGLSPHVYGVRSERDPISLQRVYTVDPAQKIPVTLFARGYEYKFLGLFKTDRHIIGTNGVPSENALAFFGTDQQGRDLYSRLLVATRTSLLIGIAGVSLSIVVGVLLGGVSGYYGGVLDTIIQRLIEILRSIPIIPLWMGLAAAMPKGWSVQQVYFAMTLILSLIGWTELGRVVRGRMMQIRGEDFVTAAELVGSRPRRVIFVHMVPLFASHIIAATTLALPLMIVAETSLSFLGLGLRAPAISWGVMLQQAQNVQALALSPWLLFPVIPVILAILAFNFLGDGLRDAADPYDS
ncbi:ABC transporter permease [Kribbella sp. NPDC049227]|uniref:ABC transporter permease n=1 Tax=Kribbella sp. NPDC049227 TaxID=3364113 RepID=UPI00371F6134